MLYTSNFRKTVIIRHRRENLKKCSLRGLEGRPDLLFFTYPLKTLLPDLTHYVLLSMEGPVLSKEERDAGILLIDGTWVYAAKMEKNLPLPPTILRRRLPKNMLTAYPRRQEDCPDPKSGLASVEALYTAYLLLGRDPQGLLDHYHWKELFYTKNHDALRCN